MHIKRLTINGFRSIKELELKEAKRINLLVGKNNCGKTSILESIFLTIGPTNPQLTLNIHNFRDLVFTEDNDFRFLFYKLDFENSLKLRAELSSGEVRLLTIKPLINLQTSEIKEELAKTEIGNLEVNANSNVSVSENSQIGGIVLEFQSGKLNQSKKITNTSSYKSQISIRDGIVIPKGYKENGRGVYQSMKTVLVQLDKRFSRLLIEKKTEPVIKVLREVDKNLIDLRMGANGLIYCDLGYPRMLPLNIMGDGIRRVLAVILAVSDAKDGILLIDELENGFHYRTLSTLWKALIAAAKEFNVQIFATTHSYECIKSLKEKLIEENDSDFAMLYRIERDKEDHEVIMIDQKSLISSIESDWEVR